MIPNVLIVFKSSREALASREQEFFFKQNKSTFYLRYHYQKFTSELHPLAVFSVVNLFLLTSHVGQFQLFDRGQT